MQRLTARLRRVDGERGATAVLFALLLVPVLGFTAVAVDIGALYAERARLQVGADAAAIAVAQDCSRGNCGDMQATAQALISANDSQGTAGAPVLSSDPLSVTVTGGTPMEHWFAPVLGIDSTRVSATATVGWGSPVRGTAVLPLTFSWCEFEEQTGGALPSGETVHTIYFAKTSQTTSCPGPSGNVVPGGFAYLDTDPGTCDTTTEMDGRWYSKTGNSVPSDCSTGDFSAWLDRTVLLPLFDDAGSTGNNAWYRVYGYAAFRLTGYHLGGQYSTSPKPCGGNDRCVAGYFTRFVELSDAWDYDPTAPELGSSVLRLIR
ncbi:pilus assembly protein TadG-related protein [Blastococcus deserti]|uniref:Pilus assembly protein TadG-related protein n=1 Tax=Blastococcus deserti TaxID=2259033 RepID=A0ABW4XB46_9ACTN